MQMFYILLFKLIYLNILFQIIFYFELDEKIKYKIEKVMNKDLNGCYFVK